MSPTTRHLSLVGALATALVGLALVWTCALRSGAGCADAGGGPSRTVASPRGPSRAEAPDYAARVKARMEAQERALQALIEEVRRRPPR